MKSKRLAAILLAILMALTVIPFGALAEPAGKTGEIQSVESKEEISSVPAAYLNTKGCMLTYTEVNSSYPCTSGAQGDRQYVQIGNSGASNTTAGFESCEFMMAEGDELCFDFWYETELNYDWFNFIAHYGDTDHQEEHISGSTGGEDAWFTHTFIAPSSGWYSFRWEYTKDGSNNTGSDCVRISNVYLNVHWDYQRAKAVTSPGTGLFEYDFFNNSSYGFYVNDSSDSNHESYLRSGNYNVGSSTSQFSISEHTRPCTLKFDYAVSCEAQGSDYFDYFEVLIDGTSVLKVAGDHFSWTTFSYELSQGWHEIVFKYVKDASINALNDCACVDNIRLVYPDGDAASRWQDINGVGSQSKQVYFTTPSGAYGWGTKINESGSNMRAYSNNRYLNDSNSMCETIVNMQSGERLSFEYVVSSEQNYDCLRFYANGNLEMSASGWKDRAWHTYTFTAPSTGAYTFIWEYHKDNSNSYGWDYAYIRSVNYNGSYNQSLNLDNLIVSSQSNCDVHFSTDPRYGRGFQAYQISSRDSEDSFAAISRNRYMENTTARMEATAGNLPAGTMIYFDYKVSSESDYDELTFKLMNGSTTVHTVELGSGDNGWRYYELTTTTAGELTLVWEYTKDSSNNDNDDCAMISNLIVEKPMPSLDEALNSEETQQQLHFTSTGTYPFEVGLSGAQYYAYSTNSGVNSSSSIMNAVAAFQAGDTLSFYYNVDSESNYDWFNFYINDQRLVHASGSEGIQLYTWTASSNGTYTMRWEYTKDSSTSSGEDLVRVMEVRVIKNGGAPGHGNGDVNGDGSVTAVDAMLALRYAMHLITLDSTQLARGDVNGDGSVTTTDAITILRISMGLIS